MGDWKKIGLEKGLDIAILSNDTSDIQNVRYDVSSTFVQFHFAFKGNATLKFANNYKIRLRYGKSFLLYNPLQNLPIDIDLEPSATVFQIVISIKTFHLLFSNDINFIDFLNEENKDKKYYKENDISPSILLIINQIYSQFKFEQFKNLYVKAKVFELLSLYFGDYENPDIEQCPFLVDKNNVLKIRKAKEIIIERMTNPPTLQELSEEITLNTKQLKTGFKQIYGQPVFSFLLDYKMEYAKTLLEDGNYNVNDVSVKVGYSVTSHFISAFKKKYGITPKQFTLNMS